VLAPESQINDKVFICVDKRSIEQRIRERIEAYELEWKQARLEPWLRDSLAPVLDRVDLACVSWEECSGTSGVPIRLTGTPCRSSTSAA